MAYTGILVRGETVFSDLVADPAIIREIAMAGRALTMGVDDGSGGTDQFYLNLEALSKIAQYDLTGAVALLGFKTSDLSIVYDGPGYVKQESDHMLVASAHKFYYAAAGVKAASNTSLVLTDGTVDVTIDVTALEFSQSTATGMTLSNLQVTVDYDQIGAIGFIAYNETTGTFLGIAGTTGSTISFSSSQTAGDIISIVLHDVDYNYSSKIKGTV